MQRRSNREVNTAQGFIIIVKIVSIVTGSKATTIDSKCTGSLEWRLDARPEGSNSS